LTAKKRTKGATKRKTPLPIKKWLLIFSKVAIACSLLVSLWFGFGALSSISWRPLAINGYDVKTPLVYQDEKQLTAVLDSYVGFSLLTVDLKELNNTLEQLPWVRQASVLKSWPGKLIVDVVEHEPVAFWNGTDVLNSDGIPLAKPVSDLQLASLYGPEGKSSTVMTNYLQFARIFSGQRVQVTEVLMRPRGAWTVTLGSNLKIVLGEKEVLERSRRIVKIMNNADFDVENIEYIDARYPNGVAVKMKEELLLGVENDIAA